MKKTSVLLLCLLFLFGGMSLAGAATGDETGFSPAFTEALGGAGGYGHHRYNEAFLDGAFYVQLLDGVVYRWTPGEATATAYCDLTRETIDLVGAAYDTLDEGQRGRLEQGVMHFTAGDGALWAWNAFSGRVGILSPQGVSWSDVRLDVHTLHGGSGYPLPLGRALVQDGGLYLLLMDESQGYVDQFYYALVRFDLESGQPQVYKAAYAQNFAPYGEERMLLLRSNPGRRGSDPVYLLSVLDLGSGEVKDLSLAVPDVGEDCGSLAYDPATESIYVAGNNQLWRSAGGQAFAPVGYLPYSYSQPSTPAWILPDGRVTVSLSDGLFVRDPNRTDEAGQTVTVQGDYSMFARSTFLERYPELPLFHREGNLSAADIAQAIASGDSSVDIYEVPVDSGLRALIDKGYAARLSDSVALREEFASLYPNIQAALSDAGGVPCAYPVSQYVMTWTVNPALWRHVFGDEPLPGTYAQFFGAMLRFEQEYAEAYPEIDFFSEYNAEDMTERVILAYLRQYDNQDAPPEIDSPVLREVLGLMRQVEQVDAGYREHSVLNDESWGRKPSIFYLAGLLTLTNDEATEMAPEYEESIYGIPVYDWQNFAPLTFVEGEEPVLPGVLYAAFVNVHSENRELALQYLENAARLDTFSQLYYALHPGMNEPMESPTFAHTLERRQAERDQVAEQLESAAPEHQRELLGRLDYLDRWLAEEERNRIAFSQGSIDAYRALAPSIRYFENSRLILPEDHPVSQQLLEVIRRYTQGSVDVDTFIEEFSGKVRMIYSE